MDERKISQRQQHYLQMLRRRQRRITVVQILIFVLFLVIWEGAVRLSWIDGFIFKSIAGCENVCGYVRGRKHCVAHYEYAA